MKSTSSLLAAIFGVISLINAQTFTIPPNPDNPGVCIYNGHEYEVGTNKVVGECLRVHCGKSGGMTVTGCGKFGLPGCTAGGLVDADKPFPECCKLHFDCTREDGSSYVTEFSPHQV